LPDQDGRAKSQALMSQPIEDKGDTPRRKPALQPQEICALPVTKRKMLPSHPIKITDLPQLTESAARQKKARKIA
jgi:hypothetical protein